MESSDQINTDSQPLIEKKLLEFEKQWVSELNSYTNSLSVLARGLSIPKIVANFLYQYRNKPNQSNSPFLIFLINFSDQEFSAIEYFLNMESKCPLTLVKISATDTISNKRIDLYLKGGVFCVSYKALVLDLLTKRLSPSIISGFIINNAQKVQEKSCESFLTQILRKDNSNAFIKCFSDKPNSAVRGGLIGLEQLMKSLQVNNLLLYPRIRKSIKDQLDNMTNIRVIENLLKFNKKTEEMHKLLIELMQACLDELKTQIKKFENLQGNQNQVLEVQQALLKSFIGQFKGLLGKNFVYLGQKAKVLLRNIGEIKRLLWLLLNSDCVSFFAFLNDLRFNSENQDHFSIFTYCDDETHKIIDQLHRFAKERVFTIALRDDNHNFDDDSNFNSEEKKKDVSPNSNNKKNGNINNKKTLEKEYGKLVLRHLSLWNWFRDKAQKNIKNLNPFEKDWGMELIYEPQPKLEQIIKTLRYAESKFLKSEQYKDYQLYEIKRLHTPKKKGNSKNISKNKSEDQQNSTEAIGKEAQATVQEKENNRKIQNDAILIVAKSQKIQYDIQRYLIDYFVKQSDGQGVLEEKLRYYLVSHKEYQRRDHSISQPKDCNTYIIENYYQHKLSLHLEQKRELQIKKIYNKTGQTTKKRSRFEMTGGDPKDYRIDINDVQENLVTEELIQEVQEDDFRVTNIINGYNVYCEYFQSNAEFEVFLRKHNPSIVLLYEPYLDFMRVLESYNAERQLKVPENEKIKELEIHLMMYEESGEYYQYMSTVESEKKGFQKLIDIKSKLYIELKNFNLEQQASQIQRSDLLDNTRKGGAKPYIGNLDRELDKDIIAIDSREFSCLTPIFLHEAGFWLVPLVLTVGDYVLSDEICVERKSVNTGDLFESFKSGRLLTQITNMNRYYKKPILLIEFDESIPFRLQDVANDSSIGGEVNPTSIVSKISLLTLHFPSLQIIWSKGPQHTAEIFKDLKRTQTGLSKDPDLQKIIKIGKVGDQNATEEANDDETDDDFIKYLPTEFLKKLPGIDSNNIGEVMRKCKNMVDLCEMNEEDLKKMIGVRNARELKSFLERKVECVKGAIDGGDGNGDV